MMDELISRKEVIKALDTEYRCTDKVDDWDGLRVAISIVENIPSALPERKTGKWVGYDGDWLKTMCKCSECGAMIDINEKYRNFFCYHCGAKMER